MTGTAEEFRTTANESIRRFITGGWEGGDEA